MRRRFTDEDILRTLRAGDSGVKVPDLCDAERITPKTYYLWKVRYGDLTPEELKQRRMRERRVRLAAGAIVILGALGAVFVAVVDFGGDQPPPTTVTTPRPVPRPPIPRAPARSAASESPAAAAQPAVSIARPTDAVTPADAPLPEDVAAADPEGSAIQVAAVSALTDARAARDRLVGAGYPAYLTRVSTGQGDLYRVRAGPFPSRAEAEEAARHLERDGYGRVWIVK